ncbi:MAG: RusA family crossover junction endodeoxyribonuclease [Clostridiales bacterium]|nr:RusA family crossover junction endodeoxyribonuclease [Clostridiales bacterium]
MDAPVLRIEMPIKLPSLNEYVNACRSNPYVGAKMKKDSEELIGWFIKKIAPFRNPVEVSFTWIEPNRRRDVDNISFAKKFILDALVKNGVLQDDSQKYVRALSDSFQIGKDYMIILEIKEIEQ